jgi:hypothetical protein
VVAIAPDDADSRGLSGTRRRARTAWPDRWLRAPR